MKKKTPALGFRALALTGIAVLTAGAAALYFASSPDTVPPASASELRPDEKAAVIHVNEGSGWLSTGEDLQIAEWYSGSGRKSDYFANFRGSDGGATVDLRLSGLGRSGTFACAEPAHAASVELRVDVDNAYRSSAAGDCRVTVTRFDGEVMEGHYQATLTHFGDDADKLTISGNFRATRPQPERLSAAGASVINLAADL
jgi:hypothetical protein